MRNIAIVLALVFAASTSAFAQKRSDLTGPAYKNYKPWKNESKPTQIYSVAKSEKLTGPAFKNKKAWKKSTSDATYTAVNFGSERTNLTGPAYKNYKPWRKSDNEGTSNSQNAKNED